MLDFSDRKAVARYLLEYGVEDYDRELEREIVEEIPARPELLAAVRPQDFEYPDGLRPRPQPGDEFPDPEDPLPRADILVFTWTIAELNALADVMTPGVPRRRWNFYRRRFDEHYAELIRVGAPAAGNRRLGSWMSTKVGGLDVICFKSELHLNQDGINLDADRNLADEELGYATLPVRDMFVQTILEVQPSLVITTGTSGGVDVNQALGDVVVTRGARFRLSDEFRNEPFDTSYFDAATELMASYRDELVEPAFAPPTKRFDFDGDPIPAWDNVPKLHVDGRDMPEFHPILTTDFFEFGTSANNLGAEGCAVEMGDAVLGLAAAEDLDDPPRWVVVRNISDPQINADLQVEPRQLNMQTHWAVWYYEKYGYWTSVSGALATWALCAAEANGG